MATNFTGRSLGKGNIGFDGGAIVYGSVVPSLKFAFGATQKLDVGLQLDSLSAGIFGKYSFINGIERGFSLAGFAAAGACIGGYYFYTGPVISVKSGMFEPYLAARINLVHFGQAFDYDDEWIDLGGYSYFQFTLGNIFWIGKRLGLAIEATAFSGNFYSVDMDNLMVYGGLKIKF